MFTDLQNETGSRQYIVQHCPNIVQHSPTSPNIVQHCSK